MRTNTTVLRRRAATAATLAAAALCTPFSVGQELPTDPVNGMRPVDLRAHAITNATVITAPGEQIENATIVIRNGVIEAVGPDVDVPADARQWSGEGMTIYPGLIDASLLLEVEPKDDDVGSHWNDRVHPELSMADYAGPNASKKKQLREAGFTVAAIYPQDGIFRGTGAVIALGDDDEDLKSVYASRSAMMMGFDYGGGWGSATYPGSHMGAIALIRQTFYDAQWHAACRRVYREHPQGNEPPAPADALAALNDVVERNQTVLFEVGDELKAIRAARIADEFNLDMMLLGSGLEFRRLDQIVGLNMPIIVPLEFPDRPGVASLHEAQRTSLRELATWEQAPTNPRRLIDAGATIALTTHRLGESKFHGAVRDAIRHGLAEADALAALTTTPAKLLGLDNVLGTIDKGKIANLVVVEGNLFEKDGKIRDTWVNGRRYEISRDDQITLTGSGMLATSLGHELDAELDTTKSSFTIVLPPAQADDADAGDADAKDADDADAENADAADADADDAEDGGKAKKKQPKPEKIKARKTIVQRDQVSCVVDGKPFDSTGYVQLAGVITDNTWKGVGRLADRTPFTFTVTITEKQDDEGDEQVASKTDAADAAAVDSAVAGRWDLTVESDRMPQPVNMVLSLLSEDDVTVTGTMTMMGRDIELGEGTFSKDSGELLIETSNWPGGMLTIAATIEGESIAGTTTSERGEATFTGRRLAAGETASKKDGEYFEMPPDELTIPLGAFGLDDSPKQQDVLVRGATIWTAGPDGIIEQGDLYISDGKIEYVGPTKSWAFIDDDMQLEEASHSSPRDTLTTEDIRPSDGPLIIDARGMHVTPGLIDCHSHTGIDGGVNEWTQVNTAEVRIADVIDPDDINWYRQLAGGLTACNQLHGSANPIGGQNSVVKLKWSGTADDFLIDDAIAGIKFALGENVKRSRGRYPNTRMGVETVIRDAFTAAQQYEQQWQRYLELPSEQRRRAMPPRRDLEMETLVEILNGERIIHCHSYRQDEILMLIRVADSFGFTIGTFQHVLEGYKVAEAIGRHGAGASSFSDWWAYKVEVMDAIPYNGALMTNVGVNVSFNSDSSELARRMNNEASKAVRYGGLDPHEALKLVTINPAWQLRIDHRTGSLEKGKDGDFVIWNGDPLSTYSRCQQTWIEGACYYDIDSNETLRHKAEQEHQRLVQKVLAMSHGEAPSAKSSEPSQEPEPGVDTQPTGELAERIEAARQWMKLQVQLGHDPETIQPGDCGCNDYIRQLMQTEVQR